LGTDSDVSAESSTAAFGRSFGSTAALDAAILIALKLLLGAYVLFVGFSHVSDDDYARTVIAQQFARAPRLDPSATSWLPLPFWIEGAVMALAGRTLAVARTVGVVLGAASVVVPYLAWRAAGMQRVPAFAATAVAMALPWNAWLGVATVPESWSAAFLAASVIALNVVTAAPWAAGLLLASSLSRYEAWPACALFAALCVVRGLRAAQATRDRTAAPIPTPARRAASGLPGAPWICAAIALSGPVLWMAWNAHAHGSALHFLARVSNFRRASGAADISLWAKVFGYPQALFRETPEAAILGLVGAVGLLASPKLRSRWLWTAISTLAVLAFLIEGDLRDGAPTHHPERALAALWWVLPGLGIDTLAHAWRSRPLSLRVNTCMWQRRLFAFAWPAPVALVAWGLSLPSRFREYPGTSAWDQRDAQIARGEAMRTRHVAAAVITPCSYEHFALLAAWGEPERAQVNPQLHTPPTPDCPKVVER
jgi:hypothetical protein